jgi:hypothetical protein
VVLSTTAPGQNDGHDGHSACCSDTHGDASYLRCAKSTSAVVIILGVFIGIIVLAVISSIISLSWW